MAYLCTYPVARTPTGSPVACDAEASIYQGRREKVEMTSDSVSHAAPGTPPYELQRRGVVLRPDPANVYEQGGVLNPAAVAWNGLTYLLYRAVATTPRNYSRILIATCTPDPDGEIRAEKLNKVALDPQMPYELLAGGPGGEGGGVEDPRVTPLDGAYYMTYTAYGTVDGVAMPRIALARSHDLFTWERLGPVTFDVGTGGDAT